MWMVKIEQLLEAHSKNCRTWKKEKRDEGWTMNQVLDSSTTNSSQKEKIRAREENSVTQKVQKVQLFEE